jgi:hypothetical protein
MQMSAGTAAKAGLIPITPNAINKNIKNKTGE